MPIFGITSGQRFSAAVAGFTGRLASAAARFFTLGSPSTADTELQAQSSGGAEKRLHDGTCGCAE